MKSDLVKFKRAPETKFLSVDQEVFDKLSPYALKVYGQLRKLTSYTKENDETEITVKNLAFSSGISERKTYEVLNELEYQHFIIQRTNVFHIRWGQINAFVVSQSYNYFKPIQVQPHSEPSFNPVDNFGQNLSPPAQYAVPPALSAVPTAQYADLKKQESLQEVSKKKHNKQTHVTVFSDTESVKNHLFLVIANRKIFVEDEIIDQGIYYSFETNKDKSFDSVNKRLNIFLKKVREGKWLIPQNFKGISSQSIREDEEEYYRKKQDQIEQDGIIARTINKAIKGDGLKGFNSLLQKLKDDVNGKGIDKGTVPEKIVSAGY